jgi:hypothetical protein
MGYNFKGADKVHVFMDDRNRAINYVAYSADGILENGFLGDDLRPIEMYNFLEAVTNSGALLVVGENNLEENLEVLTSESIFFQN